MNSYLTIAAKVLREARQPLSARQILRAAYELQIVPEGLFGKTQYKTLHARLSEDILERKVKSEFVRTDPGRFFLRAFLRDVTLPERYRREYLAPTRADQLRNFYVVCFERTRVELAQRQHGTIIDLLDIEAVPSRYEMLSAIRPNNDKVYLRVFVLLHRNREVLLRRAYCISDDALSSPSSIGFLGFVKREDKTLFSEDRHGIREAALRTLSEQLYLAEHQLPDLDSLRKIACIVDVENLELDNAIAAIVACRCPPDLDPALEFGPMETFFWYPCTSQFNDFDQFDKWSQYVLRTSIMEECARSRAQDPMAFT